MDLILEVFIIFAAAKVAGEVFVRLRQPAIAGELLVGLALGPHALGWVHVTSSTLALAQLGIVVLLFTAGLETRIRDLASVGRTALTASLLGMLAAAGAAIAVVLAFGYANRAAVLAGVALAASSIGIGARAFSDMGALGSRPARVVLGAAVVDDVVALAALPLALGVGEGSSWFGVVAGIGGAIAFVVLVAVLGPRLARRHGAVLDRPRIRRGPFVLALVLCLGLAAAAERVGLAALVGAFLAGMVLSETRDRYGLERQMEPLFDFLVPFFFVISAARVDPGALADAGALFALVLITTTVVAKLTGCGVGAVGLDGRERLVVGAGMVPRGEVTLAVAAAALAAGELPQAVFSVLVAAVLVSTLLTPTALRALVPRETRGDEPHPDIPPEAFESPGDEGGAGGR